MAYRKKTRDEHLSADSQPKRILALDGGGLRGILSVGFLKRMEDLLRERHGGGAGFRLCDYFDLIAGTSTGAIIAAALAKGMAVREIEDEYLALGSSVFQKSWLRQGFVRAKYDEAKLIAELKRIYGPDTKLGGPELRTGLLVIAKRLDSGSPWPISNNPNGQYFRAQGDVIGNGDYPLWQVVRASTAAPGFFDGETITIAQAPGKKPETGHFVDGGVSPYNNPAFQALMYATLDGYRLKWAMGANRLLLISVGTGAADPAVKKSAIAAKEGIGALIALMDDCAALQETVLQWMSDSETARRIDGEIGDLKNDALPGGEMISYARYNISLGRADVEKLAPGMVTPEQIGALSEMDAPQNMPILRKLGEIASAAVLEKHFPERFNLGAS